MVNKALADIHVHMLPMLDDGAKSWEMSEAMLRMAKRDGIRQIILTPHRRPLQFETTMEEQVSRFEEFKQRFGNSGLPVALGAENYFEEALPELLLKGQALTLAGSRYVLTEFSDQTEYSAILHAVSMLRHANLLPVLAHIERYRCLRSDWHRVEELADQGAYFQINANSLMGGSGFLVRHFCMKLLKEQLVDFVASDAHNVTDRAPQLAACAQLVAKKINARTERRIFWYNPMLVVHDETL